MSLHKYTQICFSNNLRFFADETTLPEQLHSFNEVQSALMIGKQVHFNAMMFLCQGDVPWTATGGHITGTIFILISKSLSSAVISLSEIKSSA